MSPARASRPQVLVKRAAQSAAPSAASPQGGPARAPFRRPPALAPPCPGPGLPRLTGHPPGHRRPCCPGRRALARPRGPRGRHRRGHDVDATRRAGRARRPTRDNRRQHAQRQDHDRREAHTPAGPAPTHRHMQDVPCSARRPLRQLSPLARTRTPRSLTARWARLCPSKAPPRPRRTPVRVHRCRHRAPPRPCRPVRHPGRERAVTEVSAEPAPKAGSAATMMPLVDEDDIPLTWDPVPVPRPTYTMKAMAQRHARARGAGRAPGAGRAGIRGAGPARRRRVGRRPRRPGPASGCSSGFGGGHRAVRDQRTDRR